MLGEGRPYVRSEPADKQPLCNPEPCPEAPKPWEEFHQVVQSFFSFYVEEAFSPLCWSIISVNYNIWNYAVFTKRECNIFWDSRKFLAPLLCLPGLFFDPSPGTMYPCTPSLMGPAIKYKIPGHFWFPSFGSWAAFLTLGLGTIYLQHLPLKGPGPTYSSLYKPLLSPPSSGVFSLNPKAKMPLLVLVWKVLQFPGRCSPTVVRHTKLCKWWTEWIERCSFTSHITPEPGLRQTKENIAVLSV